MLYRLITTMPLLIALSASSASAQTRFSLELNGGAAFPTEDLGTAKLKTGFGLGFTGNVRVMPHLHLYAGWDYHRFVTDRLIGTAEYDLDDTGYAFGAKFQHPLMNKMDGWVRGGGLYNHIEVEDSSGDLLSDSGHDFGWEAGGGLSIAVSDRISLMPGARYRTYSTKVDIGQTDLDVDLSYVTAELRVAFAFGGNRVAAIQR